jgi:hypothetical protein
MEYGNIEFNNGLKESIYAYHIKKIHMLKTPLYFKELKEDYNFYPPQKYIYLKNNKKLLDRIIKDNNILFK